MGAFIKLDHMLDHKTKLKRISKDLSYRVCSLSQLEIGNNKIAMETSSIENQTTWFQIIHEKIKACGIHIKQC